MNERQFTEGGVHEAALEWLGDVGWETWGDPVRNQWGADILDEEYNRERDEVVYWNIVRETIIELNPKIDQTNAGDVIESLKADLTHENLVEANRNFYNILRNGKRHTLGPEHDHETIRVRLIAHLDDPEHDYDLSQNRFDAVTEFPVDRQTGIRPDIVLFVNGFPIVPIELKSKAKRTSVTDAIKDMIDYEEDEPRLFVPALFNAVCDGEQFQMAAVGSSESFYFPWRSEDYTEESYQPHDAIHDVFEPETLLDIVRYFVFYEDQQTKIVPRYMQYQAANRIVDRIQAGDPRKGLVWHTQGSGKSYTMLYSAYKAKKCPMVDDRQYLLIVDRENLEEQMEDTLESIDFPSHVVADSIDDLGAKLSEPKSQLILTTIQKFQDVDKDVTAESQRETVVMMDEAHRFTEEKLGNRLKAAIADPFYFGFTGTPVKEGNDLEDHNTFREFSPDTDEGYLHRYSLNDGQRDGVITEVSFLLKEIPWDIPDEEKMDLDFEGSFEDLDPSERKDVIRQYVNKTELSELETRLEQVVEDIARHYEQNLKPIGMKGMVVTPSRRAAALYGDELQAHFNEDMIQVVITGNNNDDELLKRHHIEDDAEKGIIKNFKQEDGNPKLLIVCDKLLTGFDAPILKTIYLDKEMKNHRLLQTIARTNRPREGKSNGQIVDYSGTFVDPQAVLEYDDVEFVTSVARDEDELAEDFMEKLETLMNYFEDIDFDGRPETLRQCVVRLEKDEDKGANFETLYEDAEDLYESVSPHEQLGADEVEQHWTIISQIYDKFTRTHDGSDARLGDEVRSKTRRLLEKHIEFGDIPHGETVDHDLPDRDVTVKEDVDPDYAVVDEGNRLRHTYEREKQKNPAYSSLSERVKRILQRWRRDEISGPEAKQQLDEVRNDEEALEEQQDNKGLSETEDALYHLLADQYEDFVDGKTEAEEIAKTLGSNLPELSLDGNRAQIKQQIRQTIIRTLVDMGYVELAKHDDKAFLSDASDYIVNNIQREKVDA